MKWICDVYTKMPDMNNNNYIAWLYIRGILPALRPYCTCPTGACNMVLARAIYSGIPLIAMQYNINNTILQYARSACALGTGLTRPFHDDNWRQSVFIYARSYQSIKRDRIFTSFIIRGWSARWARERDWQSLLACAACLLIIVRAYLHKGKRIDW